MGDGIARIQGQGPLQGCRRGSGIALIEMAAPQAQMGGMQGRLEGDGPREGADGRRRLALLLERDAEVVVGIDVGGIKIQRLAQQLRRLLPAAGRGAEGGQIAEGGGAAVPRGEQLPIERLGFAELSPLDQAAGPLLEAGRIALGVGSGLAGSGAIGSGLTGRRLRSALPPPAGVRPSFRHARSVQRLPI